VKELMRGNEEYDRETYHKYLLRCGESLLMPVGYDREMLDRTIKTWRWGF